MKILIFSTVFYPSTGGMESVAEVLANEFQKRGHVVNLVTKTLPLENATDQYWSFNVYRNPSLRVYWRLAKEADVIFHNCVSLKQLFPDLFYRTKLFVMHQTWYRGSNGKLDIQSHLKRQVSHWVHNCFISQAIQDDLVLCGKVIPNTYNFDVFKEFENIDKSVELVFLGRLVPDKGCMVLLQALKKVKEDSKVIIPRLSVIGDGPERQDLETFSKTFLPGQVQFLGKLHGEELAKILNQHQIMVVPSIWEEPFGIVALEGLACGCLVIGSEKGGLKDAIGPCGWTFPNGDVNALALLLVCVLTHRDSWGDKYDTVAEHLYRHHPSQIASAYLDYFRSHVSISS